MDRGATSELSFRTEARARVAITVTNEDQDEAAFSVIVSSQPVTCKCSRHGEVATYMVAGGVSRFADCAELPSGNHSITLQSFASSGPPAEGAHRLRVRIVRSDPFSDAPPAF